MSEKFCADQTPQGKNIFSGCRTVYISSFVLLSEVRCTFRHMTPMTRKKPSQQPEVVFHRLTGWSMWTAHYLYRAPTNSLLIMVKASKSVGTACSSHQPPPVCHSQHDLCVSEHPQSRTNLNVLLLMKWNIQATTPTVPKSTLIAGSNQSAAVARSLFNF